MLCLYNIYNDDVINKQLRSALVQCTVDTDEIRRFLQHYMHTNKQKKYMYYMYVCKKMGHIMPSKCKPIIIVIITKEIILLGNASNDETTSTLRYM